jgi:hypothetical protein
MKDVCHRMWEVDVLRAGRLSASDADAHRRHAATCRLCRDRFAADEALVHLGRELPHRALDHLRSRRLRQALLRAAAEHTPENPRRLRLAAPGIALVAVIAAVIAGTSAGSGLTLSPSVIHRADEREGPAATVTVMGDARWSRIVEDRVERVALDDGTVELRVRHQRAGERFLVDLPDGEVEVRGTEFTVRVDDGRTSSVRVADGVVALRLWGTPEIILRRHESWRLEEEPPEVPVQSGPRAPSRPSLAPTTSMEYRHAVEMYEARDFDGAAARLREFVRSHPSAPEAEDAAFLFALALGAAGHRAAATTAARAFLERYPASFHARDARTLVAREAKREGDCALVRSVLAPIQGATREVAALFESCPP